MVNIDSVYQRVLALANKEQRGYITPLEFNLLANQASLVIFEQYFYDRNRLAMQPGNSTEYSDSDSMMDEKISHFTVTGVPLVGVLLPATCYRLGSVFHNTGGTSGSKHEAEAVSEKDYIARTNSPLLQPTNTRPIYTRSQPNGTTIRVYGDGNAQIVAPSIIECDFVSRPNKVEWGYDVIGEKALHNGSINRTFHFEHHESEETNLVMKILELGGVIIEKQQVVQYANQSINQVDQKQK